MRSTIVGLILLTATQITAATPEHSPRQIVPAAAHTQGVGGSFWRTDLVVHNPSDRAASLTLELLPSGFDGAGGNAPSVDLETPLGSMQTLIITDVVGTHFPDHATGALVVSAQDSEGQQVFIVVGSRTWNPTPGSTGSYGQGIPGVAWTQDGVLSDRERTVLGLESSPDFRSNLGLVNPTSTIEESFLVEILDAGGEIAASKFYRIGPQAHLQINDILGEFGLEGEGYTAVVELRRWEDLGGGATYAQEGPDFVVYGSKIDQRSNDPTYLEGQSETTQSGLPKHRVVPAAANTEGNDGSLWRTDVTIHSLEGGTNALIIELVPTGGTGTGGGSPERVVSTIRGGETIGLEDIIGTKFPDHEVAGLVIQGLAGGSGNTGLQVSSRTWTPTGDGGATMGQGIPGIPRRSYADPVVIPGLEESTGFRTNIGLVNPSENVRQILEVRFFDATGASRGYVEVTLEPWSHIQLNSVLHDLLLEGSGFSAVVTLTEWENLMLHPSESWDPVFMAYGSRIDRETNDPTFIEAVRLTPEPPRGQGDWYDFGNDEPWYRCPSPDWIYPVETVVNAFDRDSHWFGSENHRSITREVEFPAPQDWNQVGLKLKLECPENGLCDHWDRTGSLQLVLNPEDPEDEWEYLEIMRHITPYRVGMCQYVDITPLAPLLSGTQTLVSWIDTWVGPGHSDGEGWRISWDFVFYPGDDRTPGEVVNIWGRRSIEVGNIDPEHNVDSQIDPVGIPIPADASRVEARLITTGHSFGNSENCAEFCVMRQDLYLDGERRSVVPWRTDCEYNPVANQQGTWLYDRNGWCPGAITIGSTIDITDMVTPGETAILDFDIRMQDGSEYENTNPGGGLTPIEWVSLQVYIYRD